MNLEQALMIVYNDVDASDGDKEVALQMVLEAFRQQDKVFGLWIKLNRELKKEFRQPINNATKGYNLALEKAMVIVNDCFNEVLNNED